MLRFPWLRLEFGDDCSSGGVSEPAWFGSLTTEATAEVSAESLFEAAVLTLRTFEATLD
jgi:hypothetical protein